MRCNLIEFSAILPNKENTGGDTGDGTGNDAYDDHNDYDDGNADENDGDNNNHDGIDNDNQNDDEQQIA